MSHAVRGVLLLSFGWLLSFQVLAESEVLIVRTAPPYAEEVEAALKARLEAEGIPVLPELVTRGNLGDRQATVAAVKQRLEQKRPALVATIGTQASVPIWPVVKQQGLPMVFSAVTFPVESNLIQEFGEPTDENITGVGYSIPLIQRLRLIRKLFPDASRYRTLAFLYSSHVLQEFGLATALTKYRQSMGFRLLMIDLYDESRESAWVGKLETALQKQRPDLIFGWYSLDQLSGDPDNARALISHNIPILAITSAFLDKGAIAGILSDHQALGEQQADMIRQILAGTPAGKIPPREPREYRIELNLKRAAELKVEFPEEMVNRASRVIR